MPGVDYSLKFISGKYQGGEFSLSEGRDIIVGRTSDLDMVLMEDMVSRKHARISVRDGEVTIQDLGSTNGTFVNGERIRKLRLKNGDRILIGTSIFKLITSTDSARSEMRALEAPREPGTTTQPKAHALSGRLEDITLMELLQLLSASRKDGVLVVASGQRRGRIVLKEGRVVTCLLDGRDRIDPRKAFYRLLSWRTGTFELEGPLLEPVANPIQEATEALLMEGVRQLDEIKHLEAELPKLDDVLVLQMPILPPLRSLTPELLDTLQLTHNLGRVEAVLDQSAASDLDTFQELHYLLRNRYLRLA